VYDENPEWQSRLERTMEKFNYQNGNNGHMVKINSNTKLSQLGCSHQTLNTNMLES